MIPFKELAKSVPGVFGIRLEEEPRYDVLLKEHDFEIRRYEPMIIAQTAIEADHDEAVDEGFRRLADFIFGKNDKSEKLEMTTPVLQTPVEGTSEPIMIGTAESGWKVAFVLPHTVTLATAPKPLDDSIHVFQTPVSTIAVHRFTGIMNDQARVKALNILTTALEAKGIKIAGGARWAQYDQPFSVPVFRRNEVHLPIDLKESAITH